MMKRLLLCSIAGVVSLSIGMLFVLPETPAAAKEVGSDEPAEFVCPAGQVRGVMRDQDVRYCYTVECPSGGSRFDNMSGRDSDKCYKGDKVFGKAQPPKKMGLIEVKSFDDKKCPTGRNVYRGDPSATTYIGNNDKRYIDFNFDKCYSCTSGSCSELSNVKLVPKELDACIDSDRDCTNRQKEDSESFLRSIQDAAPTSGYEVPAKGPIQAKPVGQNFCTYYDGRISATETYDNDWQVMVSACWVGYEMGYGKGKVCSDRYLLGKYATHGDNEPRVAGITKDQYFSMEKAQRGELASRARSACIDGWTQYKIDYWYSGGSSSIRSASHLYDPGPAPQYGDRQLFGSKPTPQSILMTQGNAAKSCGTIQTAYFACAGGGKGVEASGFWSIVQTILNILLVLVAICAVGGLVYGGIRYSKAQDDSNEVIAARNIVKNVIIGLVLYVAMWALIEYLIPGGILR